jgi:hypothetical protein
MSSGLEGLAFSAKSEKLNKQFWLSLKIKEYKKESYKES